MIHAQQYFCFMKEVYRSVGKLLRTKISNSNEIKARRTRKKMIKCRRKGWGITKMVKDGRGEEW